MKLSSDMKKLLIMNSSFYVIYAYMNIFINLYIWEKSHKISDNAMFNLIMFGTLVLFFSMGAKLLTKHSIRLPMGISSLFAAIAFFSLLFFPSKDHLLWIISISVPIGAMQGFFWSGMNLNLAFFGKGEEFTEYFSVSAIIQQVNNILIPLVSAVVIRFFGYSSSFVLMFLFVSVMFVSSFWIPKLSLEELTKNNERLFDKKEIIILLKKKGLRWNFPSNAMAMVFQQFQFLFALLFTFSITDNKIYIALLNISYTIVCMLGLQIYKRKKELAEHRFLWLGLILTAVGFLLALYPKAPILVLSNVVTTLGLFYYQMIFSSQGYRLVEIESGINKLRILVMREWLYATGRVLMFTLILFVHDFKGIFFISLLIAAILTCFVIPVFQKKSMQELEEVKKQA